MRVRPPPDWSPEWEYSRRKSWGLVSVKSTGIDGILGNCMMGGAVGEAPGTAWKLPITERSLPWRRLPSEITLPSRRKR